MQDLINALRATDRGIGYTRFRDVCTLEEFRAAIGQAFTTQELADAREWLSDCQWNDVDDTDIEEMSSYEITRGVMRNFDGGLAAFIASNNP